MWIQCQYEKCGRQWTEIIFGRENKDETKQRV